MSKRVIVRLDGGGVYRTLEEAAEALEMAAPNVSRAIRESGKVKGIPMRWVESVYAVRERGGEWFVGVLNARNSAYLSVMQSARRVPVKDVAEVKDLTSVWYL